MPSIQKLWVDRRNQVGLGLNKKKQGSRARPRVHSPLLPGCRGDAATSCLLLLLPAHLYRLYPQTVIRSGTILSRLTFGGALVTAIRRMASTARGSVTRPRAGLSARQLHIFSTFFFPTDISSQSSCRFLPWLVFPQYLIYFQICC